VEVDVYRKRFPNRPNPNRHELSDTRHRLWETGAAVPRNQEHVARQSIILEKVTTDLVKCSPTTVFEGCLLIDMVKRHCGYVEPYKMMVRILISCKACRLLNRTIKIFVSNFCSGCFPIAYYSMMKHSLGRNE
jgi:hypothetical protein